MITAGHDATAAVQETIESFSGEKKVHRDKCILDPK